MIFEILGQALCGWLLADFLSGLFHWWEDRWPTEKMPLLGAWIIAPNRLHHRDPLAFTRGSFLDRNLFMIVTALIVSAIWLFLWGPSVLLLFTALGGGLINEVHRYAHQPASKSPKFVSLMQATGIMQTTAHHAVHHRAPSDRHYCILSNWCNPFLDHLGFWDRLERGLMRLGFRLSLGKS